MRIWLSLFLLPAMVIASRADSFTTNDGKTYTGTITRVEPDGVTVMTDDGVEKLYFANLPPAVQNKYNYNPAAAAQYSAAADAASRAAFNANQQAVNEALAIKQQAAAEIADQNAADRAKREDAAAAAAPETLAVLKDPMTTEEIATSPFSLQNCAVQMVRWDDIDKQEVGPGIYEVTFWGNGKSVKAKMSADQYNAALEAHTVFVHVLPIDDARNGQDIPIEALGTAKKQVGLGQNFVFFWK